MSAEHVSFALSLVCLAGASAAATAPAEPTQPFTVQDLVRLERISDVAVSPDGKRVAYTLRTTDMDANKGRTGIWLLDTGKRGAAPAAPHRLAANSNRPSGARTAVHLLICRIAAARARSGG